VEAEVWRNEQFVHAFRCINKGKHLAQPADITHQAFGIAGSEEAAQALRGIAKGRLASAFATTSGALAAAHPHLNSCRTPESGRPRF
jgi:hypothetical protein